MHSLRLRSFIAALLLALLYGPLWAQPSTSRFAAVLIIEEPQLRALIEAHVQLFVERTDPSLSEERFRYFARTAVQEIEQLLATEGYFDPKIEEKIEESPNALTASFTVTPGAPTLVSSFELRYAGAITADNPENGALRERLLSSWPLRHGSVLRSADWEKAKDALLRELHAYRFPAARIAESSADVDRGRNLATLLVALDSGPEFTFGTLTISGLEEFPQSVVSAHNTIRPGTPYSERALADFQATLQSTGYFTSVFVSVAPDPDKAQNAPILVQVRENTRRRLSLGGGYSTDTGFGVLSRYDGTVMRMPGWRARASVEIHQIQQLIQGEIQLPPVARNFVPKLGAKLKHEELEGQTTLSTVLGARLVRTTQETELAVSAQFYTEQIDVGERTDHLKSLPLNLSWTLRRLDDLLFPQRGYSVNLQVGGAAEDAISDRRFFRLYGKTNAFFPMGQMHALVARAELGAVRAGGRDGIPDDFLFRAGGSQSVRGYSFGSLGVPVDGAVVRGRYMAVASVELRQRITENWWGAVFYDTGGVAEALSAIELVKGYGAGVRWRSPLGPINFDVAYGEAVREWRLHFSVGYAF